MLKKRIFILVILLFVFPIAIAVDYSTYCETFTTADTCEGPGGSHLSPFNPSGCGEDIIQCELIFNPGPPFNFQACRTQFTSDAVICPDVPSGFYCLANGLPYSSSPFESCACDRGTKYQSVDQCGNPSGAFDSPCLTIASSGATGPAAFSACGSDLSLCTEMPAASMTDFSTTPNLAACNAAVAMSPVHVTYACRDLNTRQTFVTATRNVECRDTANSNIFGVPDTLGTYIGCEMLPGSSPVLYASTSCGDNQICRDDGTSASCVAVDCSFLRQDINLPMAAVINNPSSTSSSFTAGSSVSFEAELGPNIDSYQWNFGDGSSLASGRTVSHTYTSPSTYTFTLTVFDTYACTASTTGMVTIEASTEPITLPSGSSVITLTQPQEGAVYNSLNVPLSFSVQPLMDCSYQLNQGSFAQIVQNPGTITAKEGANRIVIRCGEQLVPRQFQVSLPQQQVQQPGIISDFTQQPQLVAPITPEEVDNLIASLYKQGDVVVTKIAEVEGGTTKVTLRVHNDKILPLAAVKLRVTFPKNIARAASELHGTGFTVVEADPVIQYDFGTLNTAEQKEATLRMDKSLAQSDLDRIGTDVTHQPDTAAIDALKQKQSLAQQYSDISRRAAEFVKDGLTFTKVTTTIMPKKKGLKDVSYYQDIPKCLAQHIDELEFVNKDLVKVVNPDPLIMWHFDAIQSEVDMSFDVKGVIDEECLKQIKDLALAEALGLDIEEEKTSKLFFTLFALPLLAFVFIYFSKFKGHLKKEEVTIAKSADQLAKEAKQKAVQEEKKIEDVFEQQIKKAEQEMKKHLK